MKTQERTRRAAYSINAAAAELDLSRSKLYDLMRRGLLRFVEVDGTRRIPGSEIDRIAGEGTK